MRCKAPQSGYMSLIDIDIHCFCITTYVPTILSLRTLFSHSAVSHAPFFHKITEEPSVPFIEFGEKMQKGQVEFVEFMAPSGDVAYVTFKAEKGKKKAPIRIGQGYPINKKGSWSSPDYVIRAVSNFGVPYKFTVPALTKYRT